MKVLLLVAVIFTLALVHGEQAGNARTEPCKDQSQPVQYKNFLKRHILQNNFDTNSIPAWEKYLQKQKLCGRQPVQSFMNKADQDKVIQICSRVGKRPLGSTENNLCISSSRMTVFHVKSSKNCKVSGRKRVKQYVVVACDKVENQCRPVHYQKYTGQKPDNNKKCS